jgi:very-short-patch-repair endonuclease
MDIESWLRQHQRIAHTADLLNAGASRYAIRLAVERGVVHRVRRDWIATTDCDPSLVLAAGLGGRLTCVTAAQRLGLWTLSDHKIHVVVRGNASRLQVRPDVTVHWGQGVVPIGPHNLTDPIENALVHIAACQPLESAVTIFDSALRKHVVSVQQLARLRCSSRRFQRARDAATESSDSGIESLPRLRLRRHGILMRQQVVIDGHPVDGLIGDRLVIQIDGYGPHSDAAQRRKDLKQDARLRLMGYTVLRFDYYQILGEWAYVESTILSAIAQGLHLA